MDARPGASVEMEFTMSASTKPALPLSLALLLVVVSAMTGCSADANKGTAQKASVDEAAFTIHIDQSDNGAAIAEVQEKERRRMMPRELAFEMAGFAELHANEASQEERAAASQAAIIDAFTRALIEARRNRGQSTSDFTAEIGPRLRVRHTSLDDGYEVRISLISRGEESEIVVRNGVLQHPPRDMRLVHLIFDETNGEFSILDAGQLNQNGQYLAKVGCYLPRGFDTVIALDAHDESEADIEATP